MGMEDLIDEGHKTYSLTNKPRKKRNRKKLHKRRMVKESRKRNRN